MKRLQKHSLYAYFSIYLVVSLILMGFALSCSEVWAANYIKIGLLEEPKTLNILRASDSWSRKVLSQIYHPLFIREPDTLDLIPWLAESDPVYDEGTLSYTVKLRPTKWSDGSELTSEDVAFTGSLIKDFKIPLFYSKWSFIKKIETPDRQTVRFYLKEPQAIFLTRTLTTPIVQKKEWAKIAEEAKNTENPLTKLFNHKIEKPVGSGPFVLKEWRKGAYLFVQKNQHFFGTGKKIKGRVLGPYIDGIIFKFFGTSDAAVLALKKGTVDMFWSGIQPGYLDDLKQTKDIRIFFNEKSGLYYMGFNVRKPPFNDAGLRRAIATIIDKDFIISRILQGRGVKMNSIVPPGNRFWYCPGLPLYGEGLSREERIKRSYEMLKKEGYTWEIPPVNEKGEVVKGKGIRLPDGKTMKQFTILTPPADYDPLRAMSGMIIQEWLRKAGIPAIAKPMAFGALLEQVKVRRQFDAFVLGYGALSLDPDYLRNFFHSRDDRPRGWNMCGYRNTDFDRMADESAKSMDRDKRQKLIWEMQKIIVKDVPYIPLYNPELIEAARKGRFSGWVEMVEGIGNTWSFCSLKPNLGMK